MLLKSRFAITGVALALPFLAGNAARAELAVVAGHSVSIMTASALDQTCRSLGQPVINILEPPHGGSLTVEHVRAYPNFSALNTRSRCNTILAPASRIVYHAAQDFLGSDIVTFEIISPEGGVKRFRTLISVRPAGPGMPVPHDATTSSDAPPKPARDHVQHAEVHATARRHCSSSCAAGAVHHPQPATPKPEKPANSLLTPI